MFKYSELNLSKSSEFSNWSALVKMSADPGSFELTMSFNNSTSLFVAAKIDLPFNQFLSLMFSVIFGKTFSVNSVNAWPSDRGLSLLLGLIQVATIGHGILTDFNCPFPMLRVQLSKSSRL